MTIKNQRAKEMWEKYLVTIGEDINSTSKAATAWYFCDNQTDALKLADLVKTGIKRGTSSLYYWYQISKKAVPEAGEYSVITDYCGSPQCIVITKEVNIVSFNKVTEEFAMLEGEGDKSLEYWIQCHSEFFARELKEIGMSFSEDMDIVCEEFELVYK